MDAFVTVLSSGRSLGADLPVRAHGKSAPPLVTPGVTDRTGAITFPGMRALLVDDDNVLPAMLERVLRSMDFEVDLAPDLASARAFVAAGDYDVIVLDLYLPDGTGIAFAADFRRGGRNTPILMLTAESAEEVAVLALDAGVDDFVVKPVTREIFIARIRALMRRSGADHGDVLVAGNLRLHRLSRELVVADRAVRLTPRELALVEFLLLHCGEISPRAELLRRVFGFDFEPGTNILEVNIRRVRAKLTRAGSDHGIETSRGIGYRLVASSATGPTGSGDSK
jgi:two-component system OmpR family response regulator